MPLKAANQDDDLMPSAIDYEVAIGRDPLSLVAAFSEPTDQLVLRQIDHNAHLAVDPQIASLMVTGRAAIELLSAPHSISRLQEMHLSHCTDAILIELSERLQRSPNAHATLILQHTDFNTFSERGLQALSVTNLAGLVLRDFSIKPAMSMALSQCTFPISIYLQEGQSDASHVSRIPSLRVLHSGYQHLSEATVNALREHPSLTELKVLNPDVATVSQVAQNPRLRSLTVIGLEGDTMPAFEMIAANQMLTSLRISVKNATEITALARNSRIETLELYLTQSAVTALPQLAAMPALQELHLTCPMRADLPHEHIRALCEQSFNALHINAANVDQRARAAITATQARHLSLVNCTPLDANDVDRLHANRWIRSLELFQTIRHDTALQWSRGVPATLDAARLDFASPTPDADRQRLQSAWRSAGKARSNLDLGIYQA